MDVMAKVMLLQEHNSHDLRHSKVFNVHNLCKEMKVGLTSVRLPSTGHFLFSPVMRMYSYAGRK